MDAIQSYLENAGGTIARWLFWGMAVVLLFGAYKLATFSLPMQQGDYVSASQSYAGDDPVALYDQAIILYQRGDYKLAHKLLVQAKSACTDSKGQLPDSRKALAAEIQFLQGNVLAQVKEQAEAAGAPQEAQKAKNEAVEAYQEALRLNPNQMYAKYNLELLQQKPPSGGGGKSGDDKKNGSPPPPQPQPGKPGGPGKGGAGKGI